MNTPFVNARVKERGWESFFIFKKVFHKQPKSWMDVIEMSTKGVTKGSLMNFMHYLDLSTDRVAHMLPITVRTIQRYSSKQKFSPTVSEHIIQLVLLVGKGIAVFGSRENFLRWFDTPSKALGGKAPSALVSLKTGAQLVMDELGRIEYGVYALGWSIGLPLLNMHATSLDRAPGLTEAGGTIKERQSYTHPRADLLQRWNTSSTRRCRIALQG
jgi:putative toxin-antitoxin system antitoxin component (TIGR02293 family)